MTDLGMTWRRPAGMKVGVQAGLGRSIGVGRRGRPRAGRELRCAAETQHQESAIVPEGADMEDRAGHEALRSEPRERSPMLGRVGAFIVTVRRTPFSAPPAGPGQCRV